jgi:hypothetical protein
MEHTFIMIKPDGVQRGLVSTIFFSLCSVDSIRFDGRLGAWLVLGRAKFNLFFQVGEIISRFEKKGFYLKGI